MTKTIGVLSLAVLLLASGAALAHDPVGHGSGRSGGASAAAARKFQKETQALREELAAKRIDLGEEYDKDSPDPGRISAIRKEIGDLEARIQAAAEEHGMGRRGWSGMMGGWSDHCGCGHCR